MAPSNVSHPTEQLWLVEPRRADPCATPPGSTPGCHAVVRFACDDCGTRRRVALDCTSVCARCPWLAQSKLASTLSLLPRVPVRHWTFRPPPGFERHLRDPAVLRRLVRPFLAEVFATIRALVAPPAGARTRGGAVSVVHRANAALDLDPHLHALVLDGLYRFGPDAEAVFVPLAGPPSPDALGALTERLQFAMRRELRNAARGTIEHRRIPGPPARPSPPRRVRIDDDAARPRRTRAGRRAIRDGLEVFASSAIAADDRPTLARVARYLTRPVPDPEAFSSVGPDTIRYRLEHPFSDGTTHVEFDRQSLQERLLTLLPRGPRADIQFHGVLAPRAAERPDVVPGQLGLFAHAPLPTSRCGSSAPRDPPVSRPPRTGITPVPNSTAPCHRCGGPMRPQALEQLRPAPSPLPVAAPARR